MAQRQSPPLSKEELEAQWAESLEQKFLSIPLSTSRVSHGISTFATSAVAEEEELSCRPVHGSDGSILSKSLSDNFDETGDANSKQREDTTETQLIYLGLGIPDFVDIDGPTKKIVETEMSNAMLRGSPSDKIAEGSSGGSGATPRRPIVFLRQGESQSQTERCLTPQRSRARINNQQPASPGNRSHASQIYHYTYEEDLRTPPSPVPPFVVVSNSGVARVSLRHSADYELDQRTILEDTIKANRRAFRRKAGIFCLAAVLALAVITLVAGIVGNLEKSGDSNLSMSNLSPVGAPSMRDTTAPVSSFIPQPTVRPGMHSPDSDWNNNFSHLGDGVAAREETLAPTTPGNARSTRPPWTNTPSEAPSITPSLSPSIAISDVPSGRPTESELIAHLVALIGSKSPNSIQSILQDPTSIASTAFDWIVADQLEMASLLPDHRLLQRFALACFYYALGGPNWDVRTSWLSSENECDWYTTTPQYICDSNGAIKIIHLEENGASGYIPSEVYLLATLQRMNLRDNEISGSIPTEFGQMEALEWIELDRNALTGSIPTEMGNLVNLGVLGVGENYIEGTVPTEIGNLDNLDTLRLSNNSLEGTIPTELGSMKALRFAFLCSNRLSGQVPASVGALRRLEEMKLTGNNLSGRMPHQICKLRRPPGALSQLTMDCDKVTCAKKCCTGCDRDALAGGSC